MNFKVIPKILRGAMRVAAVAKSGKGAVQGAVQADCGGKGGKGAVQNAVQGAVPGVAETAMGHSAVAAKVLAP